MNVAKFENTDCAFLPSKALLYIFSQYSLSHQITARGSVIALQLTKICYQHKKLQSKNIATYIQGTNTDTTHTQITGRNHMKTRNLNSYNLQVSVMTQDVPCNKQPEDVATIPVSNSHYCKPYKPLACLLYRTRHPHTFQLL